MPKSNPAKLTDLQLLLLSKASQRDDLSIELPPNLKGGAADKVVKKLLDGGLAEEVAAKPGMPVWRREDESRSLALIITRGAFEALGIEPDAAAAEATPASQGAGKAASKRRAKEARSHIRSSAKGTQEGPEAEAAPRTGTKQALVITLLQREHGATIDDLIAATNGSPTPSGLP